MKSLAQRTFWFSMLLLTQSANAGNIHKYWVCGITTYQSTVGGISQQGECRANTAYSALPCREFMVEFEGADGVRPDKPYRQTANSTATNIEIKPDNRHHTYRHTITKGNDYWLYNGKCSYFEAPTGDKVYMDKGLDTGL